MTGGVAPLSVAFTDTSSGSPTAWSWDFGDGSTSSVASPSHTFGSAGSYAVRLSAGNAGGTSTSAATVVTVTAPVGQQVVLRVNAGGPALAGGWSADTAAAPSPYSNAVAAVSKVSSTTATVATSDPSVPAGTPMALVQTARYDSSGGKSMIWTLPVPAAGRYTVRLYFNEPYWTGAGQRLFDVDVNGTKQLTGFDIFAASGGKNHAVVREFPVTTTGPITVTFGRTAVDNPIVAGLEVLTS